MVRVSIRVYYVMILFCRSSALFLVFYIHVFHIYIPHYTRTREKYCRDYLRMLWVELELGLG